MSTRTGSLTKRVGFAIPTLKVPARYRVKVALIFHSITTIFTNTSKAALIRVNLANKMTYNERLYRSCWAD